MKSYQHWCLPCVCRSADVYKVSNSSLDFTLNLLNYFWITNKSCDYHDSISSTKTTLTLCVQWNTTTGIVMLKRLPPPTRQKISRPSLKGRQCMAAGCFSGYCFFALHHKSTQGTISFFWTIINANFFNHNYKSTLISYDDYFLLFYKGPRSNYLS